MSSFGRRVPVVGGYLRSRAGRTALQKYPNLSMPATLWISKAASSVIPYLLATLRNFKSSDTLIRNFGKPSHGVTVAFYAAFAEV
jgi:hypothetical protein